MQIALTLSLCVAGVIMLVFYANQKSPLKTAFKGMASGGILFLGVSVVGSYFGYILPVNIFNTAVSLILGVPGVALLFIANILLV